MQKRLLGNVQMVIMCQTILGRVVETVCRFMEIVSINRQWFYWGSDFESVGLALS
jgi:hypothetical protein